MKLIDFGIAREYKEESNADTTYIGTKGYAAPEQFGKAQTDARTDIYSLGVTMYHIMTGKSPYEPPYQFVPARELNPALSHGMEYILNKCIQSEPEARYQSVDELLFDLEHSFRFDKAYQKYLTVKRGRVVLIALMLAASIGMIAIGRNMMIREKEECYVSLLSKASTLYTNYYDTALESLDKARELFPERVDANRQQTYALYLNGRWQECIDFGNATLTRYGNDIQTRLSVASAQFELGDYANAAEGFAQGGDLSAEHLRDYAVCLGRMGQVEQAELVIADLIGKGANSEVTQYVQGELSYVRKDYPAAEQAFLDALEQADSAALRRRCYISLGDVYRDCAALMRVGDSPIAYPATKSAKLLSTAVVEDGLRYDSVLWEMLGLAYFEAVHTGPSVPQDYLNRAADCFDRVMQQGVVKEYLYSNLYTIYYELENFEKAEQVLQKYEEAFPNDYMPHALRGMMLITIENKKPQKERDYSAAAAEYDAAGDKIRNSDETTYYQQLGSLIDNLKKNGWL